MENPFKMGDLKVPLFSEISIWVKSATLQAMVDQNLFFLANPYEVGPKSPATIKRGKLTQFVGVITPVMC